MSFSFPSASTGCNIAWKCFAFSVNTIHDTIEATLSPTGLCVSFTVYGLLKFLTSLNQNESKNMPKKFSELSKADLIFGTATLVLTLSLINFIHYRHTSRFFR